jgi:hypothetical protein
VDSPQADADLRLLAQNCLAKAPSQRLDTVKWDDFSRPTVADPLDAARRRIAQHKVASAQAQKVPISSEDSLAHQCFALRTSIYSSVVNAITTEGLPKYSLQTIREPNPYLLRALFEPSAKDGLENYFSFYCQGTAINPTAELRELRLWGCISLARELVPAEPDPKVQHVTVTGALIEQDIRAHVQHSLLIAYAEALDSSVGSTPVLWLKAGSTV